MACLLHVMFLFNTHHHPRLCIAVLAVSVQITRELWPWVTWTVQEMVTSEVGWLSPISFQSAGTGEYVTPTRHLNFHFTHLAVRYELFPRWNSKTIGLLLLDLTQQFTQVLFAKTPRELLLEKELLSSHYAGSCTWLNYERFENCWKHLAERCLVLQTCVLHHTLVEISKDKTESCCKD